MPTKKIASVTVEVDAEGFMTKPDQWTKEIAVKIAQEEGIKKLTDAHWKVIEFMRNDFSENGQVPTIRRLNKVGNIPTKELYALFPNGPAKKAAKISGLNKPQGCV
jgi:dissimilatory sulfite reductase related protein